MAQSTMARGFLAALWLLAAGAAFAQQVPTPAATPENASPTAQAQRQVTQPLNNAPVWRDVRSGEPAVTTVRGRETNVLIQPQGQTWRAARVPLIFGGGVLVALSLLGLAVTYLVIGAMDLAPGEKHGGKIIERFSPMDRYAHWFLAIVWVTLGITGLILSLGKSLLLPLIGYTLFSWLAILAKNLHNFVGPLLIVAIPWMIVQYIRYNGIGAEDVKWFLHILDYFRGHEYPSERFNAGEKLVFWVVLVLLSTLLVISGVVLVFPNFDQTRSTMQWANVVHLLCAYGAIALALVHMYLGTIGQVGSYRAMRYGYVDESWAKHHHERWYRQVVDGTVPQKFVDPKVVPPEALLPGTVAEPPPARTRPA
ncbi:MAG TPA: formate dehydrogenase subunit gamma [Casimicrobiaceae bacterium]|nr:formate dehydrogenase subunit gamma [Casimicrobiaceae bacterium]